SGGMRRRLLVAQALVHRPRLVILDEPTAGVDVELRRRLWDFMRELNRGGTTILLTTHYLEEAEELCEHVAILDRGRLLAARPMRELMNEVADSRLWLRYPSPPSEAELRERLPELDAELRDGLLCLPLSRRGEGTNFDDLYRRVTGVFGPPLDAGVAREDLEDVFLRLTGRKTSAEVADV
ncbi:MAG: ABC transporter ATP-binding protein, partial [Mariprofundaceae bacterium]